MRKCPSLTIKIKHENQVKEKYDEIGKKRGKVENDEMVITSEDVNIVPQKGVVNCTKERENLNCKFNGQDEVKF